MNIVAVLTTLNRILELELAGVVHYTHYALMVTAITASPSSTGFRSRLKRD